MHESDMFKVGQGPTSGTSTSPTTLLRFTPPALAPDPPVASMPSAPPTSVSCESPDPISPTPSFAATRMPILALDRCCKRIGSALSVAPFAPATVSPGSTCMCMSVYVRADASMQSKVESNVYADVDACIAPTRKLAGTSPRSLTTNNTPARARRAVTSCTHPGAALLPTTDATDPSSSQPAL